MAARRCCWRTGCPSRRWLRRATPGTTWGSGRTPSSTSAQVFGGVLGGRTDQATGQQCRCRLAGSARPPCQREGWPLALPGALWTPSPCWPAWAALPSGPGVALPTPPSLSHSVFVVCLFSPFLPSCFPFVPLFVTLVPPFFPRVQGSHATSAPRRPTSSTPPPPQCCGAPSTAWGWTAAGHSWSPQVGAQGAARVGACTGT